jgi:hypothetical protein
MKISGAIPANSVRALFAGILLLTVTGCGGGSTPASTQNGATSSAPSSSAAPRALRGCVPECLAEDQTSHGVLGAGTFTAGSFVDGNFQITLPGGTWRPEDNANELMFEHTDAPNYFLAAWVDAYAVDNGKRLAGVASTPPAMTAWILRNRNLTASVGPRSQIGGVFPARTVDIAVSRTATSNPASWDCPSVCYDYLGIPNLSTSPHGLARPGKARLYFSEIQYGGKRHLLTLAVEVNKGSLSAVLPAAEGAIATIRIPAQAG